jgi:hypothetical protein
MLKAKVPGRLFMKLKLSKTLPAAAQAGISVATA